MEDAANAAWELKAAKGEILYRSLAPVAHFIDAARGQKHAIRAAPAE
jgi:hypothetical protein